MIELINRKKLDIKKYDACVQTSLQSNIFGFSWYLDIVSDKWSALVLNDYEAVMPIPWRKKYFMKYVYHPFWVIQLGIYSTVIEDENEFLIALFSEFKYVSLRTNKQNSFSMFHSYQMQKKVQTLSFNENYQTISLNYNRNRKRELKKATQQDLTECWNDSPKKLIDLFKNGVGKRVQKLNEKDYMRLYKLMSTCIRKNLGELLTVYDKQNNLISAAFFLKYNNRVIELVCASDLKNRNNGANTFMNDRAIFKYERNFEVFDFGGSSMKNIAKYYYSFGGKDEYYTQLHYNNLPKLLRFFKR